MQFSLISTYCSPKFLATTRQPNTYSTLNVTNSFTTTIIAENNANILQHHLILTTLLPNTNNRTTTTTTTSAAIPESTSTISTASQEITTTTSAAIPESTSTISTASQEITTTTSAAIPESTSTISTASQEITTSSSTTVFISKLVSSTATVIAVTSSTTSYCGGMNYDNSINICCMGVLSPLKTPTKPSDTVCCLTYAIDVTKNICCQERYIRSIAGLVLPKCCADKPYDSSKYFCCNGIRSSIACK